jgi:L-seryl-tRNA(Ser) seleniumtransferase
MADSRRAVPRTDTILADTRLDPARSRLGTSMVLTAVQRTLQQVREGLVPPEHTVQVVLDSLPMTATSLQQIINATGVVLHTNLGRAPLSSAAVAAIETAAGYVDVEYDLASGHRATRGRGALQALRDRLPEAGDVMVVNNGAAALLLAVTMLAAGRELVWSRGEMVEIGDGFRLPSLVAAAGVRIREVGTTNRTTAADYLDVIGADTGCILKVHPSNFAIVGFHRSASIAELAALDVPLIVDVGSGLLAPDALLPDEPDVNTALARGADLVTASGDKLLGGPQAGIIAGRADLVAQLRRHPMSRAFRVDKMTLSAIEATLVGPPAPAWLYLHADPNTLAARCRALAESLGPVASVAPSVGRVGGGAAPELELPGWAVAVPSTWAESLRVGRPAVITRVEGGRCLVDLRCVPADSDVQVLTALRACL